jgi:hypothetical protein
MKTKAELADFLREASSDVVVPHDDMVDIFNDVGLTADTVNEWLRNTAFNFDAAPAKGRWRSGVSDGEFEGRRAARKNRSVDPSICEFARVRAADNRSKVEQTGTRQSRAGEGSAMRAGSCTR